MSRSKRQLFLKNDDKRSCVDFLDPDHWVIASQPYSHFPIQISCYESEWHYEDYENNL